MSIPELKFDDKFRERLKSGEKTATFRIGLDSEIEEGKEMWVCDSDGNRIMKSRVLEITGMTITEAVRQEIDGHKSYESPDELVEVMESYYPEEDIHRHTPIDVVRWGRERETV
jgi:hypothetical protein